jgi:type I restriction enzyme R subunit
LNPKLTESDAKSILESLKRDLQPTKSLEANKEFTKILREGKKYQRDADDQAEYIDLIDFDNPENNEFTAVPEAQYQEQTSGVRFDYVLYVNGIPLVVIECKSTAQGTTVDNAIQDLQYYEDAEPRFFTPVLFNAAVDGDKFRYGAPGASDKYYFPWKTDEDRDEVEQAVEELLNPETLLDILEYFVFYEGNDAKIIPRHMQYEAANRVVERLQHDQPRKGLIWHTQGSGKTYTMLYIAYKAEQVKALDKAKYVIIVDRDQLNEQLQDNLESIDYTLFDVAKTSNHLEKLLGQDKSHLIVTTIQKFEDVGDDLTAENDYETVVLVDEAHRFMEKKLGNKLHSAITSPYYFGFTGTPVQEGSRDTFDEFSPDGETYVHRYSIKDGQRDGFIVPVRFEVKQGIWDVEDTIDEDFKDDFHDLTVEEQQEVIKAEIDKRSLAELKPRIKAVIEDIYDHYRTNVEPNGHKAMIIAPSRRAAAMYGDELQKYMQPSAFDVIISDTGKNHAETTKYIKPDEEERKQIDAFKEETNPKILIVCGKLLTGFDAPILRTIYLDKPLRDHTLLQAIARANRQREGKQYGEVIDYRGILQNPSKVLNYDDFVVESAGYQDDEFIDDLRGQVDELIDLTGGLPENWSETERKQRVSTICKSPATKHRFLTKLDHAEELYANLQPHEALGRQSFREKWEYLEQLKQSIPQETSEDTGVSVDDKRIQRIIEENVDVKGFQTEEKEVDLPERDAEEDETVPDYQFITKATEHKTTLNEKARTDPFYESLKDRVEDIIEDWEQEKLDGYEALQDLNKAKKEETSHKRTVQDTLSQNAIPTYSLLADHLDEDKALGFAEDVQTRLSDVQQSGNKESIEKAIRRELLLAFKEHDELSLIKDNDALLDQLTQYTYRAHTV